MKNPIELARRVMEHSPHVMLVGEGAEEFAQTQGVEMVLERVLPHARGRGNCIAC